MTAPGPLVVVFLRGGMDGLSMLRPPGDELDRIRGPLALSATAALGVGGGDGWALHPAMSRLAARAAGGHVAFVPACGHPDVDRSHFAAQFVVERCGPVDATTGFLGRALAASNGTGPLRGVSIGQPQVPAMLRGADAVIAATDLGDLALRTRFGVTVSSMSELWAHEAGPLGASATAALHALEATGALAATTARTPADALVATFRAGVGCEVGVLNSSNWDHHNEIGIADGSFATLAAELDATIETLLVGIPGATVLVLSEFGRRVAANDSGGFDHGRGGLVMVAGDRVRGGVHGDWPGLGALDAGDVRAVNDLRVVVAEVAERVLGVDADRVAPGAPATRLGIVT